MALEFALRPRLRLHEPAPRRRVARLRFPALALPIAGYWLGMGALVYFLIDWGKQRRVAEDTTTPSIAEEVPALVVAALHLPPEPRFAAPAPPPASPPPRVTEPAHDWAEAAAAPDPSPPAKQTAAREAALRSHDPASGQFGSRSHGALEPSRGRPPPEVRVSENHDAPPRPAPAGRTATALPQRPEPSHLAARNPSPKATALPSCESVIASANQSIDLRTRDRDAPDLTRDAFAAVLENGTYLAACSIPARTALDICAAVQEGRVVGVSVSARPADSAVSACVRATVAGLRFPHSARLDVTKTHFDAER